MRLCGHGGHDAYSNDGARHARDGTNGADVLGDHVTGRYRRLYCGLSVAMQDMAAIHPRDVTLVTPADARGDTIIQPVMDGNVKVFDLTASVTVVAIDGEMLAPENRYEADSMSVAPDQRVDVVWTARAPGKWLVHCHIPHHTTNNNVKTDGAGGLTMYIEVTE